MSDNKTIKNFSAADIEKYWTKKLSPGEMHEMEKAAMDDPFLADAIEGYKNSSDTDAELSALKAKFEIKVSKAAPVIPLQSKKYPWLKIAAAIVVIVGAGLGVQQLVLKNKNETSLATAEKGTDATVNKDTNQTINKKAAEGFTGSLSDSIKEGSVTVQSNTITPDKSNIKTFDSGGAYTFSIVDSLKGDDKNASAVKERESGEVNVVGNIAVNKRAEEKKLTDREISAAIEAPDSIKRELSAEATVPAKSKAYEQVFYSKQSAALNNRFNYRIVDAQNNPVPFANVLSTRDNVGTYTDVRGYFNLVSADSVLDVQVRSLGFNSENFKLVPSSQPNNLTLKEDATARNFFEDNFNRRVMSNVSRKDSAEIEEPEVGWGYYNTYVENNIKIPENVRAKNALSEVELSFDVDKTGQPINIKVTRSSQCKECDEEAKRLLKEGPKWKRKGRKFKTTISISVDQK